MTDRTAASAGFVLAGVALAATVRWWSTLEFDPTVAVVAALVLAAVASLVFALRRYDRLGRVPGAVVAGLAALGVATAGVAGIWRGGLFPGAAGAVVLGFGATVAAYADWLGMERDALLERVRLASLGGLLGVAGIAMLFVWQVVLILVLAIAVPDGLSSQANTALSTLTLGAGTLTVAAAYLRWSEHDWSFIDLHWPSLRHLGYAAAGIVGVLGANVAIALLFQELQVESATHSVVETARGDPSILLVLVPLSYLVIAPGEELLYRNVIQKALRESFSPVAGVVVASVIFAAVHLPAYSSPDASLLATLNTLVVIFAMALVLGAIYERTRNVVVPILVHGTFNAIAFAATYAELSGMAI